MSIHLNSKRKTYFICYKEKMSDGTFKTITIANKNWTIDKGKKYMKSIEQYEIEQNIKKRKLKTHIKGSITLPELVEAYHDEIYLMLKKQTAYGKELAINKYFLTIFPTNKALEDTFTISTIETFKKYVIALDFSQKRTNDLFRYLKEMLTFASEREYISYELTKKLCVLLKPIKAQKERKEKLCYWTNEQWDQFYNSFEDIDKFKILFEVCYKAALRMGELVALKWEDFDYNHHTLSINKSADNSGIVSSTKNSSSNATVSIPKDLCDRLVQFKKDTGASDDDYMFFAQTMISRTSVRRVMATHIESSGVPYIKFHGLRHSCASRMINAGISPLIVSKHLRHSSVKETLDTYSHIFPNETIGVIDKVF